MNLTKRLAGIISLYLFTILILTLLDPNSVPSIVLVVPFVSFGVANFLTASFILHVLKRSASRPFRAEIKVRTLALLAGVFPVLLVGLQSIGQFTMLDAGIASLVFVIVCFYVLKSSSRLSDLDGH